MPKIIGQVCMYNEVEKGNLDRCLDNLKRYCDDIVIYDDASTDNSVDIARRYTDHIICGQVNNQMEELLHKQMILEKSLELGATHLFWLDCDEVLDRGGTMGGLRQLCDDWPDGLDAYSFRETNLWRSQSYVRIDSLFDRARFIRLWKVMPGIRFDIKNGVHHALYPKNIRDIKESPYSVIHYGFCDYHDLMVKIGAHNFTREELFKNAETNWILNESACSCYKLVDDYFPPGCLPPDIWSQPLPKPVSSLITFKELPDRHNGCLVDGRSKREWALLHSQKYHGDYEVVHGRNKGILEQKYTDNKMRLCHFQFDPKDKVIFDVGCGAGHHMIDCIVNGAKKVYGFEVSDIIIEQGAKSYCELSIPEDKYEFVNLANGNIPNCQPDLIYCVAVFMHIPWWQAQKYMKWFYECIKPGGEVYIQFYQTNGETLFWNNIDNISNIRLENEIERIGFTITDRIWYKGIEKVPLWRMYQLRKGNN